MNMRLFGSIGVAGGITFALFFMMQYLVSQGIYDPDLNPKLFSINFIPLIKDTPPEETKRVLPPIKELEPPPPNTEIDGPGPSNPYIAFIGPKAPPIGSDVKMGGRGGLISDGDVLPIIRVAPGYPPHAERSAIEGFVDIEFSVSKTGRVVDPRIIYAEPSSIFNHYALRAVRKWKYKPLVVDGEPLERQGLRVRIKFELRKG